MYKITFGQLITLWVFGFIGVIFVAPLSDFQGSVWLPFTMLGLLVFYTVGWRNSHHK